MDALQPVAQPIAIQQHRYLDCEKIKTKERRFSGVCQETKHCDQLYFDDRGIAQCKLQSTDSKKVGQHKDKLKKKRTG
jgi:hypothetical protein